MESSDRVTYDAVTVTRELQELAEGAAFWSADEISAWVADLLAKYQTHLARRTLLISCLKQEVRPYFCALLIAGMQCQEISQWVGDLVPAEKVAELIALAKQRVFADPPTPVRRDRPLRAAHAPMDASLNTTATNMLGDTVSPGDATPVSPRRRAVEDDWSSNVVIC